MKIGVRDVRKLIRKIEKTPDDPDWYVDLEGIIHRVPRKHSVKTSLKMAESQTRRRRREKREQATEMAARVKARSAERDADRAKPHKGWTRRGGTTVLTRTVVAMTPGEWYRVYDVRQAMAMGSNCGHVSDALYRGKKRGWIERAPNAYWRPGCESIPDPTGAWSTARRWLRAEHRETRFLWRLTAEGERVRAALLIGQ